MDESKELTTQNDSSKDFDEQPTQLDFFS